jgi:hypothetical protein
VQCAVEAPPDDMHVAVVPEASVGDTAHSEATA